MKPIVVDEKSLPALEWILGVFKKHGVAYQVCGGFAAHLYGATRPVNDIDIDIPRDAFDKILPDVKEYVTYGPSHYTDERWDIYEMMLSYHGQEIDLTAPECKIFNDTAGAWEEYNADLAQAQHVQYAGTEVSVCPRQKLIEYKKLLSGEHQKQDIQEISF